MATPTWDFPERFFIYPQGDGERRKKNYPEALGRYCLMCLQSATLFERFCQYKMCQPSTGPWWGSLHATPPYQGGEWVLPHCSALPNATSSPALCARKTPAHLRDGKGKQELLCGTGLMPLSRWSCPYFSHTTFPSSSHCWAQRGGAGSHITSCDCTGDSRAGAYEPPSLEVFGVNTLGSVSAKEGSVHRAVVTLAETLDVWLHSWTDFPLSGVFPCQFYQIYLLRGYDSWSYDQSYERATTGNS